MKKSVFCFFIVSACLFNSCKEICDPNPTACKLVRIEDYRPGKPYSEPYAFDFQYDGTNRLINFIVTKKDFTGAIVIDNHRIYYNSLGKPDSILVPSGYYKLYYTGGLVTKTAGFYSGLPPGIPSVEIVYSYDVSGRMLTRRVLGSGSISDRFQTFEYFDNGNLKKTTFRGESGIKITDEFKFDSKSNPEYFLNNNNLLFILYSEIVDFTVSVADIRVDALSKNNVVYQSTLVRDTSITNPAYNPIPTVKRFSYQYNFGGFPTKRTNTAQAAEFRTFTYNCAETPKF